MLEALLREVEPGEEVRAEDHNALVRMVKRLFSMMTVGGGGENLDDIFVFRGVVKQVSAPTNPDDRTISTVFYTVQPMRRSEDCRLIEVRPINPPTRNPALVIVPCQVGDFCLIVRFPNEAGTLQVPRMVQFTETVDDGGC